MSGWSSGRRSTLPARGGRGRSGLLPASGAGRGARPARGRCATGDRSTERLLQETWRIDPAKAGRLVDEAEDLAPRCLAAGPAAAAAVAVTATVLASGEISPEHVAIIRRTMTKIDRMEHVDPPRARADAYLAEKATLFPPATLRRLADALLRKLDPDGAAPDEDADLFDDLKMTSGQDGIAGDADQDPRRGGRGDDPRRHPGAGHPDRRGRPPPVGQPAGVRAQGGVRRRPGPDGLVTDTRQNEHQRGPTRQTTRADAESDAERRALEDALIPDPAAPNPRQPSPGSETDPRAGAGAADDHDGSPLAAARGRARHSGLRRPVRPGHRAPVGLRRRDRPDGAGLQVRTARHRAPLAADPRRDAPGADLPRRWLRVPRLHPTPAALPRPPRRTLGRRRPDPPRQPHPAVPTSPPGHPPRPLDHRHDRRPPVVHPATLDRPERQPRPGGRSAAAT